MCVAPEAKLAVIKSDLWQPRRLPRWRSPECPAVINTGFVWLCVAEVCVLQGYLSVTTVYVRNMFYSRNQHETAFLLDKSLLGVTLLPTVESHYFPEI